jgi:protein SCO1
MTRVWRLLLVIAVVAGCGPGTTRTIDGLHGFVPPAATPRPSFTLTTLRGQPFAFDRATAGRLTFLFFGYTNCPDVCPATMANLGAVLGRLTAEDRRNISVVFVTTDPERDTPERLTEWLHHFDPAFIGLTGTPEQVTAAQQAAGVAAAVRDTTLPSGEYFVSHAAQVIVVSPDDSVHIQYPAGTMQRDWADDLPGLRRLWSGAARRS